MPRHIQLDETSAEKVYELPLPQLTRSGGLTVVLAVGTMARRPREAGRFTLYKLEHMMKQALVVVGLLLVTLAFPHTAQAQATQGDKEVLVQGSLISTLGDFGFTNATAVLGLGYFVSNRLQIGVQPILSVTRSSGETTFTLGSQLKAQYYLGEDQAKVKPYFGGSFIINDFSDAGNSAFAAAVFGVKSYLTEKAALDINASYGFGVSAPSGTQLLQAFAGISYIF